MNRKSFASVVLLACVMLFATREAQAFYNPSTGRWLSRDPIVDTSFISEGSGMLAARAVDKLNLYNFTINAAVNWFDRFGLDCECGPDITDALKATLDEVAQNFGALDASGKLSACAAIAGRDFMKAWDIDTLAYTSPQYKDWHPGYKDKDPLEKGGNSHCCPRSCKDTVVINGKCVYSHQATYALFGKIGELCSFSLLLHPAIDNYKKKYYPKADKIFTEQAHAMTDYGNGKGWPSEFDGMDCAISGSHKKTAMSIFEWTWEPFHPRKVQ